VEISISSRDGGVGVAHVTGRIDLLSASNFKRLLVDAIGGGQSRLVVDLNDVTFIDSSGLGALIGVLKAARQAGGDMRIARPTEQAKVVLDLTTLDRVLTPYPTVDAALDAYD
jgi:anti-sigma B factor antagonist